MPIYEILVIKTNKFKVQVEAKNPEQALGRAEELALTEESWYEGTIEHCEEAICELKNFPVPRNVREHEEGWKYIA